MFGLIHQVLPLVRRPARWAPWLPCAAGLAWLAVLGWQSRLQVDLFTLLRLGGVALLGAAAARRWSPLIVGTLLLAPVGWHFAVALPAARTALERAASDRTDGGALRVEAVIRDRWQQKAAQPRGVRLLLGEATLTLGAETRSLAELEVELPAASAWTFRSGRRIRISGVVQRVETVEHRLRIAAGPAAHVLDDAPGWPWGEAWRVRLRDRGHYYLSQRASAVYLPMVLDVRDRRSIESREVVAAFRRVGVSHIFAISGMNVALIFGMLMAAQRLVLSRLQPGQGWVGAPDAARAASVALIWFYIAMIGLPPPAVRAAIMGSALVWLESRGARTQPLYALTVTGLAMLAWSPSQLYDISFQLSFLAYAFLVLALELGGPLPRRRSGSAWREWMRRGLGLLALNVGVTGVVTLGLWPLIAARFGTFSWLVFAGNLLLVPVMGAVILPSAMVALAISGAMAGTAPGGWLERAVFGWLEACLAAWLWLLRGVDRIGGGWVFQVPAHWSGRQGLLYYVSLLLLLLVLIRMRRRTPPAAARPVQAAYDNSPI